MRVGWGGSPAAPASCRLGRRRNLRSSNVRCRARRMDLMEAGVHGGRLGRATWPILLAPGGGPIGGE